MGILPRAGVALLLGAILSASADAPARACAWPDTLDFRTGLTCAELLDDPSGGYALLVLGLHDGRYFAELFAGSTYVSDDRSPELAINRAYLHRFMPDGMLGTIVQPDSSPVESARSRDAIPAVAFLVLVAAAGALGLRRIGRHDASSMR